MINHKIISARLQELRDLCGVTNVQLAAALDATQSMVNAWHRGDVVPDIESLVQICRYYGVPADYLLGLCSYLPFDMRQQLLDRRVAAILT